jgi:hypothetical protein
MKFKVDFANGRCTTISCESNEEAKKELLSVQKRFNSKVISVNDQPIEKLALGGVLLATILGGILGNQVAKSGVSKTAKTIKSTTKKTISKTKKEIAEFRSASSKSKKFETGGGVGSMGKWYVMINYYDPNAKEDRFGNKLSFWRKTYNVEASYKEEAIKKATDLYNSVKANKNRQIETIEATNLTSLAKKDVLANPPVYIEFLNKEKGFKKDIKHFNSYEEAVQWARENFEKFNPDMIKYEYAKGGKIGDEVYAYFTHNYMGYQLVESPAMGEVYDGKIIDVITENNTKKYVLKFENGETKKISESLFNDYIFQNKFAMGGMPPQLAIADQISKRLPATTAAIDKKFAERVNPTQPSMWEDRGLQKMAKGGGLNKFNFDKAELEKISSEYYNVYLYKNEKLIYKATVPTDDALMIADKHKNITLKKSFATGGTIGQEITFKHWTGDIRNGVIKEDLGKGNFEVSSGFGNVLVNAEDFISPAQKMARGGSTNERNFVNKSEDYEVRYARDKNPSRVGYKGNSKFKTGGGVVTFKSKAIAELKSWQKEKLEDNKY